MTNENTIEKLNEKNCALEMENKKLKDMNIMLEEFIDNIHKKINLTMLLLK